MTSRCGTFYLDQMPGVYLLEPRLRRISSCSVVCDWLSQAGARPGSQSHSSPDAASFSRCSRRVGDHWCGDGHEYWLEVNIHRNIGRERHHCSLQYTVALSLTTDFYGPQTVGHCEPSVPCSCLGYPCCQLILPCSVLGLPCFAPCQVKSVDGNKIFTS